jgi:hypothetical protein
VPGQSDLLRRGVCMKLRWEGCVVHMRKRRMLTVFWIKLEGTRLFGRRRHRWEDNIKIGLN